MKSEVDWLLQKPTVDYTVGQSNPINVLVNTTVPVFLLQTDFLFLLPTWIQLYEYSKLWHLQQMFWHIFRIYYIWDCVPMYNLCPFPFSLAHDENTYPLILSWVTVPIPSYFYHKALRLCLKDKGIHLLTIYHCIWSQSCSLIHKNIFTADTEIQLTCENNLFIKLFNTFTWRIKMDFPPTFIQLHVANGHTHFWNLALV
jgi:hypothetical protein